MIALLCRDEYALITHRSLKAVLPDEPLLYLHVDQWVDAVRQEAEGEHVLISGQDVSPAGLYQWCGQHYPGQLIHWLENGLLVQREFRGDAKRIGQKSWGSVSQYMYTYQMGRDAAYRMLGIEARRARSQTVGFVNTAMPYRHDDGFLYTAAVCWGDDPLVLAFFTARERVRHAWMGEGAAVLNYLALVRDPHLPLETAQSAPLERYRFFTEGLPDQGIIEKNGERSAWTAPLRLLMAPMRDYFARMAACSPDGHNPGP